MRSCFFAQLDERVISKLPAKRPMGLWLSDAGNVAQASQFSTLFHAVVFTVVFLMIEAHGGRCTWLRLFLCVF